MNDFKREVYDFLNYLPGALIEIDLSKRKIIYMNRMAFFLFGHSQSDVDTGIPLRDIFQNDGEYERAINVAKSFGLESYQSHTPYSRYEKQDLHDFMMRKKDGSDFFGECQGSFVLDDEKVPIGVRIYIRDLTEQRSIEASLQESNEKYRTLVELSSDLVFLIDSKGTVLSVNQAAAQSLGRKPDKIQGKNVSELFPRETAKGFKQSLEKIFLTGEGAYYESTMPSREQTIWINTSLNPVKDSAGKVTAILGVSRDITERKKLEELLQFRNELGSLISKISSNFINLPIEKIDEGINKALKEISEFVDVDRSYVFLFSDNMTTMSNTHEWCTEGIEPQMDKLQGLPVEAVPWWMEKLNNFENIHIPRISDLPPEAVVEKEILQDQDIQSLIVAPIIYADVLVGFLGFDSVRTEKTWPGDTIALVKIIGEIFINALERKLAENKIRESNSLKELLLDIITHDIRNPAGNIYALSEAARQDMPENKFLEAIYTSSGRLMEVLTQTTILSQAAFGDTIPKEALSLNILLQETVDDFASTLSTAEMECVVAKAPDLIIEANPLIAEVFKNYFSNAIKYAREGKRIIIETVLEEHSAIVRVKDFGKTIAEADREHIFERRAQLEEGEKRGRGLGLAIVKRIAEAHGGEVWVEPNTPHGNSFCLRIPF